MQSQIDGRVTVREAPGGYPAARGGLRVGDEILLIDGRDVRSMSPVSVHLALEGEPGTTVQLTVQRASSIERISLVRAPLAPPSGP